MQKQKNIQVALIGVLAFAVLFMSVGFAAYAQTLNINGTATVGTNKWSVHFKENSLQEVAGSVAGENLTLDTATTTANFKVKLNKPGDYYAFSVDVINDGTFDAVLNQLEMSPLSTEQSKYLAYTVSYDGTNFTNTNNALSTALNKGTSSDVLVRVEYVAPTDSADLPSNDITVNLSLKLVYNQV